MGLNYFTFGGISSSQYDIFISGEALFDAPKRNTEEVTIPGRNGSFLLDKGSYENIKVTYPAFCYSKTYAEFIDNITRFRNAVATKTGYQRLTDTFNYSEYRMAAFLDGIEVDPILYNSGAKFNVVFDCMPQRFLMSGESAIDVTSGSTMLNPTPFEAKPLIEATGYGDITFNGYEITLANSTMGNVTLGENTDRITFNTGLLNVGDTISVKADFDASAIPDSFNVSSVQSVTVDTNPSSGTPSIRTLFSGSLDVEMAVKNVIATFTAGTTNTQNFTTKFKVTYVYNGVTQVSTITLIAKIVYNATNGTIRASIGELNATNHYEAYEGTSIITKATAVSTVSLLGTPTYIDCDLGEAYKVENGGLISLDKYIDLGSDLPALAPGINTVTFDNTFTEIKFEPRWWML